MTTLLATHLWQSTLFAALAAGMAWLLRPNHARTRHLIWVAASVKFLVPFGAIAALGGLFADQANTLPSQALAAMETVATPFAATDFGPVAEIASRIAQPAARLPLPDVSTILVGAWIAGMCLLLGTWTVRWLRLRAALRTATRVREGREFDILRHAERLSGTRDVPLLASNTSFEPGVVGGLRPVILWPRDMSRRMSDEQIEAILLHELAHVKRHDNLLALVHMFVQAVFWFHPIVWWIGTRLVDERERACDEEVVRLGVDPYQYAESILRTCEYAVESPLACVAGVTGSDLKQRVLAIVNSCPAARLGVVKVALLATLAVVCTAGPLAAGLLALETNAAEAIAVPLERVAPHVGGLREDQTLRRFLLIRRESNTAPVRLPANSATAPDPAVAILSARATARDQATGAAAAVPAAPLKFEVASIKLMRDTGTGTATVALTRSLGQPGSRFNHTGSIRALLQRAYGAPFVQQLGGPDWIREDNYNITAKAPDAVLSTTENVNAMIRSLLADRFDLRVREEIREIPVYELVLARPDAKLGPKLVPFTIDCSTPPPAVAGQPNPCSKRMSSTRTAVQGQNQAISSPTGDVIAFGSLVGILQNIVQRPVIDRTGLTGTYNIDLSFTPEGALAAGADLDAPSLFTALQEQLGLKLEAKRAPMKVLVIDSIQRPTED